MSVTVDWVNEEKSAVIFTFAVPWTWDDFYAADESAQSLRHSVAYTVDIILDFRAAGAMPQGMITHMRSTGKRMREDSIHVYIVGANKLLTVLGGIVGKILPEQMRKVVPVASLDLALAMISKQKPQDRTP